MREGCNYRVLGYKIRFDQQIFFEYIRDLRTWRSIEEGLGAS